MGREETFYKRRKRMTVLHTLSTLLKYRRVIIVVPTRATGTNVYYTTLGLNIPTPLLIEKCWDEIRDTVENLHLGGFGILAGTGTGKTLSIRKIASLVLQDELKIGIVTREHEETEYTRSCNVLVVTSGIALNWLKSGKITKEDLIIFDEIHQTSAHLELSMALAKRAGCTFIWMSATVDSTVYEKYLNSRVVIKCDAFDQNRKATVTVLDGRLDNFLNDTVSQFMEENRGVVVFVPTRIMAENLSKTLSEKYGDKLYCGYYHGGKKIDEIERILRGEIPRPFIIFMTVAGASSLNVPGLDTIVILDEIYEEVVIKGSRVLKKGFLGPNHILQMGGRVNGRVENGQIYILTERNIDFYSLKPVSPRFVLGGELRQLVITCARIGVDARGLQLISGIDRGEYQKEWFRFCRRGIVSVDNRLTTYGEEVENLPVDSSWAEIIVTTMRSGNKKLLNLVIAVACVDSLHSLLGERPNLGLAKVYGSDHLTSYRIVREALKQFGYLETNGDGVVIYKLREEEFEAWCEKNGFVAKEICNTLLAMKSVYHQMKTGLPKETDFPYVEGKSPLYKEFVKLLVKVQSLDFVYSGRNSLGEVAVARHSVLNGEECLAIIGRVGRYDFKGDGRILMFVEGTLIPQYVLDSQMRNRQGMFFDGENIGGAVVSRQRTNSQNRGGRENPPAKMRSRQRGGRR